MAALLLSKCVSSVGLLQLICTIQLLITVSEAAPKIYHYKHHQQTSHTQNNKNKDESAISHDDVYNYLMEFDYLPKSDIETGALRTEEQLKDAIRNLQRFGNIPATGEIDADTRRLIMRPRCGVGDGQDTNAFSPDNTLTGQHHNRHRFKRFALQGSKWDKTDLTWSFVNQSMSDSGEFRRALSQALGVWERSSKLTFREVYSDQADIQVLFARRDHGDGYKFDGPGHVLAHAFYPGVGRGGDAHFDADEDWVFGNSSGKGTNFRDVALHEFGHSLGLGHSSDNTAIMFPWYQGYEIDGFLPDDDRLAIQELYGAKQKTWGPYNPRTRPTTTTTTTTTTTMRPREYYPQYPSYSPWYNQQGNRNPHYPAVTPRPTTTTTTTTMRPRQYYPEVPDREPPKYPSYQPSYNNPGSRNPYYPSATPSTTTTTTTTTTRRTTPRRPSHYPTKNYHYHTNKHHATKRPNRTKPDNCMTRYDAIAMIRRELFIFREQFLWRIGERGLYTGFPLETRRLWTALPENFTKIDAAYENRRGQIVFFIGRHYYVFDSTSLVPGYPKPLTALGLPASVSHIDAAFTWGHNNRTYFFSKTLYWRFDEDLEHVELDYPRDMSIWSGIGYNIDAAFQYTNGKTYFFKNLGYWEFNDNLMMVAHRRPKLSGPKWMNCPRRNDVSDFAPLTSELNETESVVQEGSAQGRSLQSSASSHWMSLNCFSVSFVLAILTKSLLLDSY